jgi:phospholipase C
VSVLPQIETIVVLMVENRSLDTMLGWLHEGDKNIKIVPQGSQPDRFDGIVPGMSNSAYSDTYAPRRGSPGLGSQRWRVPREDPAESMRNVADQMYADGSGDRQGRTWADNAPMTGFAWDYLRMFPPSLSDVMGAYTADELPILYGLAERFAASDRWFSSVPTETAPNRDFAFCGTSEGKETDLDPPFSVSAPTIFSALNDLDTSWAIYARADFGGPPFTNSGITYSELHFDGVRSAIADPQSRDAMLPYEDLLDRLKSGGELPSFCWVEPAWGWGLGDADGFVGWQGNDYHPPTWVGPAEADLADLFSAIAQSPQWEQMLFVITFDEHGGTWDHAPPPPAENPDGRHGPTGFTFERLGPRVPTLFISPFIEPGTVVRPPLSSTSGFDHTSIIRTVLDWAGAPQSVINQFGKRVSGAPMFDHALEDTVVQPHPVIPQVPASFREQSPPGARGFDPDVFERFSVDELRRLATESRSVEEFLSRIGPGDA